MTVSRNRSEAKTSPAKDLPKDLLEKLVAKAKDGDVAAFEQLYKAFATKILNYLYRMTGSREEAEDLGQETFVLAFRNLKALKDNRKLQSWLYRIAQNNVYQRYRGQTPLLESLDQPMITPQAQRIAAPSKTPEEGVLSKELMEVIQKVIGELPPKYRQVFVLSAIHRLSYSQISDIVGRSLAAVKSDIHRARVEVRNKVKSYLGGKDEVSDLL